MTEETEVTTNAEETKRITPMRMFGWVSLGLGVAAVSLLVGRELRSRYRFRRRTPYDFYENGAEEKNGDFPLGI